jgi:hypothetical protein
MSLQNRLSDFITAVGTDYKQLRTWISGSSTGNLTGLTTTDKASLIGAINEVNAKPSASVSPATEAVPGIVELATLAEVAAGTDVTRAVTVAGVRQERLALRAEILGAGVPAALDTLQEFSAALGNDANFAATTTAALGNRVRVDVATQALTTVQQSNARTNIAAVGAAEIGNPETDLVALYNTAKA